MGQDSRLPILVREGVSVPTDLVSRGGLSDAFKQADAMVRAIGQLPDPAQLDTLIAWHKDPDMSLVEMAILLRDDSGESVWDRLSPEERVILVRISHNPGQSDTIRQATLATLEKVKETGVGSVPLTNEDGTPTWLLPIECHIVNPSLRTLAVVRSEPKGDVTVAVIN